jgi:CRP-like cAMP-binding protein
MGHELSNFASIPLFAALRRDEIALILAAAAKRRFRGSEIIVSAEEPATRLFLVTKGYVDYCVVPINGEEILLRRTVPGDIFGVASFLYSPTVISAPRNRLVTVKFSNGSTE